MTETTDLKEVTLWTRLVHRLGTWLCHSRSVNLPEQPHPNPPAPARPADAALGSRPTHHRRRVFFELP